DPGSGDLVFLGNRPARSDMLDDALLALVDLLLPFDKPLIDGPEDGLIANAVFLQLSLDLGIEFRLGHACGLFQADHAVVIAVAPFGLDAPRRGREDEPAVAGADGDIDRRAGERFMHIP